MVYGLHHFHAHQNPVDGALLSYRGIAMVAKIMACPAFLYMILIVMGC
jgi:hypothetical protein